MARAAVLLTIALVGVAASARADDKQACVSAAESAQRQRSEGKLREARASLLMCSRPVCPAIVRADCTGWLNDNEALLPTLVLRAEDQRGRELSDVRVELDGEVVANRLDGQPLAADPGAHWLAFERQGSPTLRVQIVVQTGEKNRPVTVKLEDHEAKKPAPAPAAAAPRKPENPPAPATAAPSNGGAWALSGLGAAAVASFAYFGLSGRAEVSRLRSDCAGHCGAAEVGAARNKLIVADVSLGVAVVSATIATVLFVRSKREVSLAPLPSGAIAAWTERF